MLIFVLYVLVISNWHANVNSNWDSQYICFCDCALMRNIVQIGHARTNLPFSTRLAYLCSAFRPSASREQRYLAYNTGTNYD